MWCISSSGGLAENRIFGSGAGQGSCLHFADALRVVEHRQRSDRDFIGELLAVELDALRDLGLIGQWGFFVLILSVGRGRRGWLVLRCGDTDAPACDDKRGANYFEKRFHVRRRLPLISIL